MAFGRATKAALLALSGAAAIAAISPAAAQPAGAAQAERLSVPPIAFKQRRLANGLTIISLRDPTTPNVAVSLWYEVGSKHDPEGRSGFAHLFEHILSRKTVNMPYNMINKLTEDVGGVRNASTWYDRTNYYEIVPARYLETMLWTHAERMARPVVDEQVFENERNVVKEELRQRVLAPPYGRLRFLLNENSWDRMPHRRPGIGSIEQLEAATLADARAFHEAYYGPDTATLIVSGNFDEAQLQAWVDRYFAAIPARRSRLPLAVAEREPPRTAPRTVTMYAPNVPLPIAGSSWKIPGSSHRDMAALQVLDYILTSGESARLYKSLVYDKQLATQIAGDLSDVEENGYYAPYAILAGGKSVEAVETALAAEIGRVRDAPVTEAELTEAKNEIVAQSLRSRETFSGRAFELGEALVRTGDPKASDKRLARVTRVSAADVQRVARKYLSPEARLDFRYMNESARPAGQADSWTNPVPMPRFKSVPAAVRPANALADEASRQAPPAPGAAVPVTPPKIAESRLPSGLAVVTAQTGTVPLATMTLALKGGSSTDPARRAGLAAMAANLATKGTATRSAQQIAAEIESLGATLNSFATPDGIVASVTAPAANLEAAGRILADIARNATFPEEELERERKRALDELSIAMRDPGTLAALVAQPLLYGDAPYGALVSPASLAALGRGDLTAHYRQWWHPANGALLVSGGIDTASATAMAGRLFGDWRGEGAPPQPPASRAGTALRPRTLVIDMPGAGQAAVVAAVRSIDRADPDYYNLAVANAVLGAGSNGRLFEEIRTKRALSYGANSSLPSRADDALLSAVAQTKNESAADVVRVFLDEFDRLGREPFAADAIDKRKLYLAGNYIRQSESSAGFGNQLAALVLQGLPPGEAARYVAAIEAVGAEAASKVAARLVSSERASLVVVGDSSKFIDKLRAIRPDLEVIPLSALDFDAPALRSASR
jgi:zinc protease